MEVNGTAAYEVTGRSGDQEGSLSVENWLVPLIFAIITFVGVTGNAIVCYVILRHAQMRTPTNYYIMNLAITDLAFLLCCAPFTASIYATHHWLFGRALCKLFHYIIQVSLCVHTHTHTHTHTCNPSQPRTCIQSVYYMQLGTEHYDVKHAIGDALCMSMTVHW